ncbi:isochorismatase family cysteine hydrolase [Allorhizobium taibaishanense]|uniref:Amidase n=1 Tax=Allorhizobium taibaishanense TaxID=887144 RepID=A0A1Q9A070_9HYPH|nr:cysteine hydrolase family protein [Allorhizobium taibaishanense]MBB4010551.1 nicotinamidase-related amidase [Allorhizobium taibaishanense]OLP47914.1 amidase [Allorhizobium taibaishanense]
MTEPSKSALILIEYVNDWLSPTGGIYPMFQDREQLDTAVANSKIILDEARRRGMHVVHASLKFEPTYKVLGEGKYGLRSMMRTYGSFLGELADFYPGFEPAEGEFVVRERGGGSSVFVGTTLDSYLRNNGIFDIYLAGFSLRQCVESSMRNAHDLGYHTNIIYDASAGYTRKQQDDFVAEIAPFYANAITTQNFLTQA